MTSRLSSAAGLALVLAMALWPQAAEAASLRLHASVHGSNVKLSDLFTGLEAGQDCDIGPAPDPGKHIVVPTTQLVAIASQFGVDWQPGTGYASTVLERQARLVRQDEVLAVLKPALIADGAPVDGEISLASFVSPVLPAEVTAAPDIQVLDYDPQSGRFSAAMVFQVEDAEPVTGRLVGRTVRKISILTLAHALPAGAILTMDDLQPASIAANMVHGASITLATDAVGLALKRPLPANMPLLRDMLARPVLVDRGRPLILRLETNGLTLTAAGIALESGSAGDRIHVLNSMSRAVLVGEVLGASDIRIEPGSAPVATKTNTMAGALSSSAVGLSDGGRGWTRFAQEAQNP